MIYVIFAVLIITNYIIYNDSANTNFNTNCHKEMEGHYIDKNDLLYKKCYLSCKKCDTKGNVTNHNCIECSKDYQYELEFEDLIYKNCYEICPYYFYYDINKNKSYCTPILECPENYEYLIYDKNECIYNCNISLIYKYEYKKMCYKKCPKNTLEKKLYFCDDINTADEFILYMKRQFYNEINLTSLNDGTDIEEERENVLVTITTPDNQQKNIFNENKTSFNLGICKEKLKKYYNITNNDSSLYIFKVDVKIAGMKIPKILYEVYYPFYNNSNITQLNLSMCKNSEIDLYIPVILNDTKEKYN